MKTITGMYNQVNHMVNKGIIDLDDFYNVSFDRTRITLQGRFSDKISNYNEFFNFNVNETSGFVETQSEIDGVEVRIVFT